MVKIFQGDCRSVQKDINSWIDVYHPKIRDIKQSVVLMEKEHNIILVLTVFYEAESETEKVEYSMFHSDKEKPH